MSRVLNIYNSNYKIAVQDGGNITLDTGDLVGNVIVTGNLEVKGTTTTVESTEVTIADNIILLSEGTQGSGLPSSVGFKSGIQIDRGSLPDAEWVFDEQISWNLGGTSGLGTFYARTLDGQKLPINTPGIVAQGDFYVNTGNGVISVTNTADYEEKIWTYDGGVIQSPISGNVVIDDDNIPNAKAVVDYVNFIVRGRVANTIAEGDTSVSVVDEEHTIDEVASVSSDGETTVIQTQGPHGFTITDTVDIFGVSGNGDNIENLNGFNIDIVEVISPTFLRVRADTTGGDTTAYLGGGTVRKVGYVDSEVRITIQGDTAARFFDDRLEVADVKIQNNVISTEASNQDLVLSAPGAGAVKIKDILEIPKTPHEDDAATDPLAPSNGIKLYAKTARTGDVGLYYTNEDNTSGELISKNRALLFGMLF